MIYPINKIKALKAGIGNSSQAGVTLLLAILVLSSILAISFSLATITFIEVRSSSDLLKSESSLFGASAIAEQAIYGVKRQVSVCPTNYPNCIRDRKSVV